jgi:hypothetical protein
MKEEKLEELDNSEDFFSTSHEEDLTPSLREFPVCFQCGQLSNFICSGCNNIGYCGLICQQLHWWSSHKTDCIKEKKD